jgi:hypothetical protein
MVIPLQDHPCPPADPFRSAPEWASESRDPTTLQTCAKSMARRNPSRGHGKFTFLLCLLYLILVFFLTLYGVPSFVIDLIF